MLEAKYYKDYRHNYMILRCGREVTSRSYQYKILTSDKIDGILRCYVRYMNGTTYYYYDISSRTTLESLYRDRKMSREQVKDVLWQLHGICDKLSGYFMEESALVLLPEHIYYDLTNQKYIGLYYPDYQVETSEIYRPLMDFLLEHIDTQDQQLTEDMYRIYEMSEEPCFTLEDALRILEETKQVEPELIEVNTTMYDAQKDIDFVEYPTQQHNIRMPVEQPDNEKLCNEKQYDRDKPSKKIPWLYIICAMVAALGLAGAYTVYLMFALTKEEELALYGSMAVMAVCLLICLAGCLRGSRKRSAEGVGKKSDIEYFPESEQISLEGVLSRDMGLEAPDMKSMSRQTDQYRNTEFGGVSSVLEPGSESFGNTVFYDGKKIEECKLYAVDKRNKKHIELKQFPCTVGKMAGCVDYVLPDDSISRIHARFDREGEKVFLTDMNSTNGTYKNGLRMQPQETVEIEPGDEVRFGSLNYCYR